MVARHGSGVKTAPIIIDRKLGRERALGQCEDGVIEIDPRQSSRDRLDTVTHEALHHALPDASEREVCRVSAIISRSLWRDRWRRVER